MLKLARQVLAASLLLAAGQASGQVQLVYMAMFECGTCNQIDSETTAFERVAGDDYVFVPVSHSPEDIYTGLWYALRGKLEPNRLRATLFEMLHSVKMTDIDLPLAAEYLRVRGLAHEFTNEKIQSLVTSRENQDRMRRSASFLAASQVMGVPAVVILRNGAVVRAVEFRSGSEPGTFIREGIAAYREYAR